MIRFSPLLLLLACKADPLLEDGDGDGVIAADDCDDLDPFASPAAEEVCDGIDNDCDGLVDEDVTTTFYADDDGDGFGAAETAVESCAPPEGYVEDGTDCDDALAESFPGADELCDELDNDCDGEIDEAVEPTWYADADGDGYGDPDTAYVSCEAPPGYVADATDCDDTEATVWPGNEELCDELDNDCDGTTDEDVTSTYYADTDGDGFGDVLSTVEACDVPGGYSTNSEDCDDTDGTVSPNATEICDDLDNDCDGDIDGDAVDPETFYADTDSDGFGDPDATTTACDRPPGYVADNTDCDDGEGDVNSDADEVCDDIDNDCDGAIDADDTGLTDGTTYYIDYDSDGFGSDSYTVVDCEAPTGYVDNDDDCDDTTAEASPAGTEVCDDLDNDCDGTVDNEATDAPVWYADADSDGFGDSGSSVAECEQPSDYVENDEDCDDLDGDVYPGAEEFWYDQVDSDCDGEFEPDPCDKLPEAATVEYDETCGYAYAAPADWSIDIEWSSDDVSYSSGSSYVEVMMTPVVGQLTDDNGDGVIDASDTPDVAYTTFSGSGYGSVGYLRVLSGDGTDEHFSTAYSAGYGINGSGGVAIGDIDDDGLPDILTVSSGGYLLALEGDGTAKWVSDTASSSSYCYPKIHDIDADGTVELILCENVYDNTGAWLFSTSTAYRSQAVVDIDADGDLEFITASGVYDTDGTLLYSLGISGYGVAAGNFDSDEAGEFVVRTGTDMYLFDDDGTELWNISAQGYGYPCIGDLDGDGEMEIGAPGASAFNVFETDGTLLWSNTSYDPASGTMSCSIFDFDGDGSAEVVYADRTELFIWSGSDGTELYSNTSAASGSLYEHPVIVDVDGDGATEIVFASNNYSISGYDGVYVLGEDSDGWAPTRTVWNQEDYTPNAANEDGSIPSDIGTPFDLGYRIQTVPSGPADAAPDWFVEIIGACEDCDETSFELYVVADNLGSSFGPTGMEVRIYAVDGTDTTLLDSQTIDYRLEPGERTAPMTFNIDFADVGPDGLMAVIDDDDDVNECDEDNNQATWSATCE